MNPGISSASVLLIGRYVHNRWPDDASFRHKIVHQVKRAFIKHEFSYREKFSDLGIFSLEEQKRIIEYCAEDNRYIAREYLNRSNGELYLNGLNEDRIESIQGEDEIVFRLLDHLLEGDKNDSSIQRADAAKVEVIKRHIKRVFRLPEGKRRK